MFAAVRAKFRVVVGTRELCSTMLHVVYSEECFSKLSHLRSEILCAEVVRRRRVSVACHPGSLRCDKWSYPENELETSCLHARNEKLMSRLLYYVTVAVKVPDGTINTEGYGVHGCLLWRDVCWVHFNREKTRSSRSPFIY